jgi:hypothetical protein
MKLAIYEAKNSDKTVRFISLTIDSLTEYCSKKYAKKIIEAHENGQLWGVCLTKSGRIKASFC